MRGSRTVRLIAILLVFFGVQLTWLSPLLVSQALAAHDPGNKDIFGGVWNEKMAPDSVIDQEIIHEDNTPGINFGQNFIRYDAAAGFLEENYPAIANNYWSHRGTPPIPYPPLLRGGTQGNACTDKDCIEGWYGIYGPSRQVAIQNNWDDLLTDVATLTSDLKQMNDAKKDLGGSKFNRAADGKFTFNTEGNSLVAKMATDVTKINQNATVLFKILMITGYTSVVGFPGQAWWSPGFVLFTAQTDLSTRLSPSFTGVLNNLSSLSGLALSDWLLKYRGYQINKPTNLATIMAGSDSGPKYDSQVSGYQTLADFARDYSQIRKLADPTVWTGANNQGLTFDQIHGKIDPILGQAQATPAQGGAVTEGSTNQSIDPCGGSTGGLTQLVAHAFCSLTVVLYNISIRMVAEAANLLQETSDIVPAGASTAIVPPPGILVGNADYTATTDFIFGSSISTIATNPIEQALVDTSGGPESFGGLVSRAYNAVLGLVDAMLVFAFILVALANILQVQLNTYAVKKLVPGLIIGFIIAQFSFFFVRASLEISGQITRGVVQTAINKDPSEVGSFQDFVDAFTGFPQSYQTITKDCVGKPAPIAPLADQCSTSGSSDPIKMIKLLIVTAASITAAVFLYIVGFLLLIRRFVFVALVPIAPAAVFGYFFPPLKVIWTRWWKNLWSWLLMPVIIGFWLWMALVWFKAVPAANPTNPDAGGISSIFGYAFGIVCLYMAMRTPFSMAADAKLALDKWNSFGKENIGRPIKEAAIKYTPAGAVMRGMKNRKADRDERSKDLLEGDAVKSRLGRMLGGDVINRRREKGKLKFDQSKRDQKALHEDVEKGSESLLYRGRLRTISDRLLNSESKRIQSLGRRFRSGGDKMAARTQQAQNIMGRVGLGGVAAAMTQGSRESLLKDTELKSKLSGSLSKYQSEDDFFKGDGDRERGKRRGEMLRKGQSVQDLHDGARKGAVFLAALKRVSDLDNNKVPASTHDIDKENDKAARNTILQKVREDAQKRAAEDIPLIEVTKMVNGVLNSQVKDLMNELLDRMDRKLAGAPDVQPNPALRFGGDTEKLYDASKRAVELLQLQNAISAKNIEKLDQIQLAFDKLSEVTAGTPRDAAVARAANDLRAISQAIRQGRSYNSVRNDFNQVMQEFSTSDIGRALKRLPTDFNQIIK